MANGGYDPGDDGAGRRWKLAAVACALAAVPIVLRALLFGTPADMGERATAPPPPLEITAGDGTEAAPGGAPEREQEAATPAMPAPEPQFSGAAAPPAPPAPLPAATAPAERPAARARTATAAPTPSPPPRPTAPKETVRVQLASLGSEAAARREWERIRQRHPALLGGLRPAFVRADLGGGKVVYRVQAGPLSSDEAAARLCGQLRRHSVGCVVAGS